MYVGFLLSCVPTDETGKSFAVKACAFSASRSLSTMYAVCKEHVLRAQCGLYRAPRMGIAHKPYDVDRSHSRGTEHFTFCFLP